MKVDVYQLAELILASKPTASNAKYRPGEAIERYRKARKMHRHELSAISGVHINVIARIEKTNQGTWHNIVTLLDALGVDLQLIA